METPWFSTFTLFTELLVTTSVFYIFYQNLKFDRFPGRLTAITLGYETLFNISYMTYRSLTHVEHEGHVHTPLHIAVAAFHGIFSLSMFIALIVFMVLAWRAHKRGENFFRKHLVMSKVFLVLWAIAIVSGMLFYYLAYFTET
jgi:heme A synthase